MACRRATRACCTIPNCVDAFINEVPQNVAFVEVAHCACDVDPSGNYEARIHALTGDCDDSEQIAHRYEMDSANVYTSCLWDSNPVSSHHRVDASHLEHISDYFCGKPNFSNNVDDRASFYTPSAADWISLSTDSLCSVSEERLPLPNREPDHCLPCLERYSSTFASNQNIHRYCFQRSHFSGNSQSERASQVRVTKNIDISKLPLQNNLRLRKDHFGTDKISNGTFSKRSNNLKERNLVIRRLSRSLKRLLKPLILMMTLLLGTSARSIEDVSDIEQYNDERATAHRVRVYSGASERQQVDSTTYLMRYGYLPGSDLETGALRTDEELMRAVIVFQKNANIPVTGRLDEITLKAMRRSRCGVTDVLPSHGHLNGHTNRNSQGNSGSLSGRRKRNHHRRVRHEETKSYRRERGLEAQDWVGRVRPRISAHRGTRSVDMVPQEYTLGPSVWQKKWLTFRIMNYTPDLDTQETRDAIIRAFHLWSDVTQLTFHEVQSGHADIYILFASGYHNDGYTFDGQGMVLAHAFFPGEDRGGDIHLDEDETWTVRTLQGVNLYSVVAHELGHSLGLAHSYVPGSLMYPWHRGFDPDLSLHNDDIIAIQYLYGARDKNTTVPTNVPPPITRSVTPPTITTTTTLATTTVKVKPVTKATVVKDPDAEPDRCDVTFDSLSLIRGDVFAFTGKWFWRMSNEGLLPGYPVQLSRFWFGLPKNLTKIDAVFERPANGHIVFFSGTQYFEFYGNTLLPPYAPNGRPVTDFGLPSNLKGIDAAFVWAHNQRIYLIKDTMYWKLDEAGKTAEYGYPRDMSMWGGVPLPVDAAFTHTNQHTYFFHGGDYYEFNNIRMNVRQGYPKPLTSRWLGCETPHTKSPDSLWQDGHRSVAVESSEFRIDVFIYIMSFISLIITV